MAVGRTTFTFLDKEGEGASVSVHTPVLNVGNIVATLALITALEDAIEAVSKCVLSKTAVLATETELAPTLPTDAYAQRGIKFLVRARDTNGNAVTFRIPGANLELAGLMIGENMDLTSTEGAALVSAIEDVVLSNDGEAIVVQEIVYID